MKYFLAGWAGANLIRLLMKTLRLRVEMPDGSPDILPPSTPMIYALWHAQMFIPIYVYQRREATVLISKHRDGEYINRIVTRMGYRSVRGSTTRGATSGLRALLNELKAGREVAFTPDGPRGPRHVLQSGIIYLAERSGCPIVPVAAAARKCWRLGSWDRFIIPKPFTTAVVCQGEPVGIPPGLNEEQRQEWRSRLETTLMELSQQARQNVEKT